MNITKSRDSGGKAPFLKFVFDIDIHFGDGAHFTRGSELVEDFTKEELKEALRAISSTISKCEKVQPKLKQGTSQHTLLIRRIKALRIASSLITRELENME